MVEFWWLAKHAILAAHQATDGSVVETRREVGSQCIHGKPQPRGQATWNFTAAWPGSQFGLWPTATESLRDFDRQGASGRPSCAWRRKGIAFIHPKG